jgi:hypothetical protein
MTVSGRRMPISVLVGTWRSWSNRSWHNCHNRDRNFTAPLEMANEIGDH